MDFNCGTIIDGTESIAQAGERFFQLVLRVASGLLQLRSRRRCLV
jgi:altronate dehydratase